MSPAPEWHKVVIDAVNQALRDGLAVVPAAITLPADAEAVARGHLRAYGHEPAIAYEPIQDGGVRLIRTDYWKPEMRLNDQSAAVDE